MFLFQTEIIPNIICAGAIDESYRDWRVGADPKRQHFNAKVSGDVCGHRSVVRGLANQRECVSGAFYVGIGNPDSARRTVVVSAANGPGDAQKGVGGGKPSQYSV
jgi:hypothetical protein